MQWVTTPLHGKNPSVQFVKSRVCPGTLAKFSVVLSWFPSSPLLVYYIVIELSDIFE